MGQETERTVFYNEKPIQYILEQKQVKNLNLRIKQDGSVWVSADPSVPLCRIDEFVVSKGNFICTAQKEFKKNAEYTPSPKQYISGESFCLLGKNLRLKVICSDENRVFSDGVFLRLYTDTPENHRKKEKLIQDFFNEQCKNVFRKMIEKLYPVFKKYGAAMPELSIRNMKARWGSCIAQKGKITLNKRLIEAPENCIEYVVMHELCHLIYPNHSKQFYALLTMMMPDWKERKNVLEKSAVYWL